MKCFRGGLSQDRFAQEDELIMLGILKYIDSMFKKSIFSSFEKLWSHTIQQEGKDNLYIVIADIEDAYGSILQGMCKFWFYSRAYFKTAETKN